MRRCTVNASAFDGKNLVLRGTTAVEAVTCTGSSYYYVNPWAVGYCGREVFDSAELPVRIVWLYAPLRSYGLYLFIYLLCVTPFVN